MGISLCKKRINNATPEPQPHESTLQPVRTPMWHSLSLLRLTEPETAKQVQERTEKRILLITQTKNTTNPPQISIIKEVDSQIYSTTKKKKVKFFDFKGLMASAFTSFDPEDDFKLQLTYIDNYAKWLKSQNVTGVLVNGVSGEGPSLTVKERKLNAVAWWKAAIKYDLVLMVQVGGAPLPDVLKLAKHANALGVHAVMCLPELLYKPSNVEELVLYCKKVAKQCSTRPFFYCHYPKFTHVDLDMGEFCDMAEHVIMNFFGIEHGSSDLEMGARCLREGRVILLGRSTMLASAMLLGFDSVLLAVINIRPDLVWAIYNAMTKGNLPLARKYQLELNTLTTFETRDKDTQGWIEAMKQWFHREMSRGRISEEVLVGPARTLF